MSGTEYGCDRCGVEVPDGAGHYVDDDRLCVDCAEVADGETETRTYRVTLVIKSDTNPAKWAWDELVISDDCEALLAVDVQVVDGPEVTA